MTNVQVASCNGPIPPPDSAASPEVSPTVRVLVVGLNYTPEATGIAPYTTGLSEGLARLGHEVQVLTAMPHYPEWRVHEGYDSWVRQERIEGVTVHRVR